MRSGERAERKEGGGLSLSQSMDGRIDLVNLLCVCVVIYMYVMCQSV